MVCMYIETLPVPVIAPNATLVVYGILFGGMFNMLTLVNFYITTLGI